MKTAAKRLKKGKIAGIPVINAGGRYMRPGASVVSADLLRWQQRRTYREDLIFGEGLLATLVDSTRRGALLQLCGDRETLVKVSHLALARNWAKE